MARKISPSDQEKLIRVVEKTASLVDSGLSPNQAIEKLARDNQLRPGAIDLVVHAYNTARTNHQRTYGSDIHEKSASFETADAAVIREAIFPAKISPAELFQKTASADSNLYRLPAPGRSERSMEKAASAQSSIIVSTVKASDYPEDGTRLLRKKKANVERVVNTIEAIFQTAAATLVKKAQAFDKLTSLFAFTNAPDFALVKEAAAVLGDSELAVMQALETTSPKLLKKAYIRQTLNFKDPIFSAIHSVVEATQAHLKAASDKQKIEGGLLVLQAIVSDSDSDSVMFDFSTQIKQADMPKFLTAAGMGALVQQGMTERKTHLGELDSSPYVDKAVNSIGSPSHEANLRRISVQAMLQKLITKDPYLSGHKPDDVAEAFNQIQQIAPEHATRELTMRMALRRQLAQEGLESHDQMQLLNSDKALRDQKPLVISDILS